MPVSSDLIMSVVMKRRPRLHGYAWVVTGDPDLAEDVLQEVSLLALQKKGQINDETHLLGWLHESIRRQGLSARRAKMAQAMQLSSEVLAMLAEVQADQHNAGHAAQVKALRQCIELLGDKSRDTLALRYGKGMKPAQIAQQTDRPVRSVYQMITRAHTSLRQCVTKRLSSEGSTW
ncbi:MAG: sigma-70 family RNA polymerase sigma factor [Phycisphaeraceae bacterium]|nr:sigma-70 family RNA polymerase sigma factor [Phycisphaeraceae bacterium]